MLCVTKACRQRVVFSRLQHTNVDQAVKRANEAFGSYRKVCQVGNTLTLDSLHEG